MNVDLPAPFGPRRPVMPDGTDTLTSFRPMTCPYHFDTRAAATIGAVVAPVQQHHPPPPAPPPPALGPPRQSVRWWPSCPDLHAATPPLEHRNRQRDQSKHDDERH